MIEVKCAKGMWFAQGFSKGSLNGPTDSRESSLDTDPPQVVEDQDQEPDQNDNRQGSITAEKRGSGEDGVLQPQDIEVEGGLTDLQKWLGLKEFLPQVISQCLAV